MIRSFRKPMLAAALLVAVAAPLMPTAALAQTVTGVDGGGGDPTILEFERWVASLEANPSSINLPTVKSRLGQLADKFKQKAGGVGRAREAIKTILAQIKTLHEQAKGIKNRLKSKSLDAETRKQLENDLNAVHAQIGSARNKLKDTIKQAQVQHRDARQAKQLFQRTTALVNRLLQTAKKGGPSPAQLQTLLADLNKIVVTLVDPQLPPPVPPEVFDSTGE